MFQALNGYLTATKDKVVRKEDLLTAANGTLANIHKEVLPALAEVSKSKEFFTAGRVGVLEHIASGLEISGGHPENVIKHLEKFFKDVDRAGRDLTSVIENDVSDKIFHALATAQDVAAMKTVSDITSVTLYTLDMLYLVIIDEDTVYPKKKISDLHDGVSAYIGIIRMYQDNVDKHFKDISKVAKTEIKRDAPASLMDKLFASHGIILSFPMVNGFIHNPIYHVRMWMVDEDVEKLDSLREKKKLLEIKLLEMKMGADGKHNDKLKKQVAYYEDKISSIEYDIKEIQDVD